MTLSEEEVRELKEQLKEQVQHLPSDKKKDAEQQIDSMSADAIEEMVRQQQSRQQIYRMVVSGELEGVKVDENDFALAVMEIRPITKGHVIIIPKTQVTKKDSLPNEVLEFSKKISDKIQDRLKPKKIVQKIEFKFGEIILDLIPDYGEPIKNESQREQIQKEELEKIAKEIMMEVVKPEKKVEVIEVKKVEEKSEPKTPVVLRRRVP